MFYGSSQACPVRNPTRPRLIPLRLSLSSTQVIPTKSINIMYARVEILTLQKAENVTYLTINQLRKPNYIIFLKDPTQGQA